MVQEHILLVVWWVVFGVWHSVFAAAAVKQFAETRMGRFYKWYRPVYSVVALVQTVLIIVYLFSVESIYLWENTIAATGVFILLALAGLVLMSLSVKKYFFNLSGIGVLYKKRHQRHVQREQVLETSGLHEYVRHPLYSGTLLFAWSVFLIFPFLSFLLTCIAMTVYTLIGIQLEEKKLLDLFGQQYRVYKNNVPMIIPFTKFGRPAKPASNHLS